MHLRIAARKSDLARIQAYDVGSALERAHPGLKVEYLFRESLGDKNLNDPLWKMPEKGVFTEDFVEDLKARRCDCVIHSFKDLPTEPRPFSKILTVLERQDPRDVLLIKKSALKNLGQTAQLRIFSSSPRREFNISSFLKSGYLPVAINKTEFLPVRGNVPTRIRKLFETPDVDALTVAAAALLRLLSAKQDEFKATQEAIKKYLAECFVLVLPITHNPTAPAQGALAAEISADRPDLEKLFAAIHNKILQSDVAHEREELQKRGGGCHQKLGATSLSGPWGQLFLLRAEHNGSTQELRSFEPVLSGPVSQAVNADGLYVSPKGGLFDRHALNSKLPAGHALLVTKADALPHGLTSWDAPLWTAGLKTWKQLAERGFWVSGSCESLGEENLKIPLQLFLDTSWTKLSHTLGHKNPAMAFVATYELKARVANPQTFKNKTHFYWSSGSELKEALKHQPDLLKSGFHACGPGSTLETLKALKPKSWGVFLSADDFRDYFKASK